MRGESWASTKIWVHFVMFVCMAGVACSCLAIWEATDELDIRLDRPSFNILRYSDADDIRFDMRGIQEVCIGFDCLPAPIFQHLHFLNPLRKLRQPLTAPWLNTETSRVKVLFENENRSPQLLEGMTFEINLSSPALAEASFSLDQQYDAIFRAHCGGELCATTTFAEAPLKGQLLFGPNASLTIRLLTKSGKEEVSQFNDVHSLDMAVASRVAFLVFSKGLVFARANAAVIEPVEPPDFTPQRPDTLLWKNKPVDTHGERIRSLRLRPGDGYDIRVGIGAGQDVNTTTVVATATGIARIAVNDVQALPAQLGYEITHGPYRFAKQQVSGTSRDATFRIFEKSKELDLTGVSISSESSDIAVTFREPSLYPLLDEFSSDNWEYLENLNKKYRAVMETHATMTGRIAQGTSETLVVDYVLRYLLDEKKIATTTYDRLDRGRKFVYLSDLPKDPGSDEELFTRYVADLEPGEFLDYLAEAKFPQESRKPSSDLDRLSLEVIQKFRQWLPGKVQRGTKSLKIAELAAGEKSQITAVLQLPRDVGVATHNLELLATWSSIDGVKQTAIELPIEIYDKWHWLKIALIWLAGVAGVAIINLLVKQLFDITIAEWLKRLYERYIRKRRCRRISAELICAICEVWPPSGKVPGGLVLDATVRIKNGQERETSVRCSSCKVRAGKMVADLSSVELMPEGIVQKAREVQVAAASAVQMSISSAEQPTMKFLEVLRKFQTVRLAIVFEETFGATTTVKSQIAWRNRATDPIREAAPPAKEVAAEKRMP